MLRRSLLVVCFALFACRSTTLPANAPIERYLRNAEALGFDGQVVVMRDDAVLHDGAYGFADREHATRVTPRTTFGIASESKQFTAAAILRLEADGKLRVEDTIDRYIDGVPADKRDITIHQLLTHSAGLPQGDIIDDFQTITPSALIAKILAAPRQPAGTWRYSNAGYNLLAAIIERASGMSYPRYLRTAIFDRAGLRHTGVIGVDMDRFGEAATAYRGFEGQGSIATWLRNWRTWGGGDLFSTAEDLAKFATALREGRIVPPAQFAKMIAPHVKMQEDAYGYAWFVNPELREHGGDTEKGFSCAMRYYPATRVTLVLTCNRSEVNGIWLRWGVQDSIAALAQGKEVKSPLPDVAPATAADGIYTAENGARLSIQHTGGQMLATALDQKAVVALWNVGADAPSLDKAIAKTATMLETVRDGKVNEAMTAALYGDGAQYVPEYLEEWESLMKANGRLRGFAILGALPIRQEAARTFVRLDFERGPTMITYLWRDKGEGRVVGSSPGDGTPLARVVARDAKGGLVTWAFGAKAATPAAFENGVLTVGGVAFRR